MRRWAVYPTATGWVLYVNAERGRGGPYVGRDREWTLKIERPRGSAQQVAGEMSNRPSGT